MRTRTFPYEAQTRDLRELGSTGVCQDRDIIAEAVRSFSGHPAIRSVLHQGACDIATRRTDECHPRISSSPCSCVALRGENTCEPIDAHQSTFAFNAGRPPYGAIGVFMSVRTSEADSARL
jgi:hypothetical protein